jgi:hypothetical protein
MKIKLEVELDTDKITDEEKLEEILKALNNIKNLCNDTPHKEKKQ